jgi:predicted alpha/beta superfamily hydrolase
VTAGKVIRHAHFPSRFVSARHVDVWLPEQYSSERKYAVLYMHDGQMLFDSGVTWNKQTWDADDAATRLMRAGKTRDFIVVGVWNGGLTRHSDYFPQKPFESLPESEQKSIFETTRQNGAPLFAGKKIQSDHYLAFMVKELKPFIDSLYSTLPDRPNTFVAGSSMGGLISLYAICEYPDVFGGAACLSTHWPGIFTLDNNPIPDEFIRYMSSKLPDPATHKLYFDYGTATLDALYPSLQKKADQVMRAKGYGPENWQTLEFPGAEHTENAWRKRLEAPLEFLLRK